MPVNDQEEILCDGQNNDGTRHKGVVPEGGFACPDGHHSKAKDLWAEERRRADAEHINASEFDPESKREYEEEVARGAHEKVIGKHRQGLKGDGLKPYRMPVS